MKEDQSQRNDQWWAQWIPYSPLLIFAVGFVIGNKIGNEVTIDNFKEPKFIDLSAIPSYKEIPVKKIR